MTKRAIHAPEAAPPGGPYSHAVVAGDFVYLAGATPHRRDRSLTPGGFEEQARATFENLATVAATSGASLADAVRVGVYLLDLDNFAKMNELFAEYFPSEPPARTTLQANLPGFEIEIDAVLYRPQG